MDDFCHLLTDCTDLRGLRVGRLLDLILPSLGKGNSKQPEEIIIRRFDGHVGLDERLPLSYERAQFIRGKIKPVEVGETVFALNFVDSELYFSKCMVLVLLQVCE